MKKALCLCLCFVMLCAAFAGCGSNQPEDIVIPMYLSSEIINFDPAVAYTDEGAAQLLGFVYEGLYSYDKKGKPQMALADTCTIEENEEKGEYSMTLTLKDTAWSDGTAVTSTDFIYAFRRILEPDFYCEAASLLYDLKNARLVKSGDASIDDLGMYSLDTKTIQFVFEKKIDYEQFKEVLCSPALYPLREEYVTRTDLWANCASSLVCNGPFAVRVLESGKSLILERNIYYFRKIEEDKQDSLTKYVVPYRLVVNYRLNEKKNLEAYDAGSIAYNSGLPIASRAELSSSAEVSDLLSTLTYVFNTTKEPFNNADVRKALSMAIDRNAVVELVTFAKAAEGLVPYGVYNTKNGTSFRENSESLISATGDIDGAKALLKSAGVKGGEFTISVRDDAVELAVAEYVKGVWTKLGFDVEIVKLKFTELDEDKSDYDNMYIDTYTDAYKSGDFDVISVDSQSLTKYAFNVLAPFAKDFAGGAMDMTDGNYAVKAHISGYDNETYNALIEEAYAAGDDAVRAELLHKAEAQLMNDMPVIPVIYYQNAYLCKDGLKDFKLESFGIMDFDKATLKNYESYTTAE